MRRIKGVYRYYRLLDEIEMMIGERREITPDDGSEKIEHFSCRVGAPWKAKKIDYASSIFMRKERV